MPFYLTPHAPRLPERLRSGTFTLAGEARSAWSASSASLSAASIPSEYLPIPGRKSAAERRTPNTSRSLDVAWLRCVHSRFFLRFSVRSRTSETMTGPPPMSHHAARFRGYPITGRSGSRFFCEPDVSTAFDIASCGCRDTSAGGELLVTGELAPESASDACCLAWASATIRMVSCRMGSRFTGWPFHSIPY